MRVISGRNAAAFLCVISSPLHWLCGQEQLPLLPLIATEHTQRYTLTPTMKIPFSIEMEIARLNNLPTVSLDMTLTHTSGRTYSLKQFLYDDGLHQDAKARDGKYGNQLGLPTPIELGKYGMRYSVSCPEGCGTGSGSSQNYMTIVPKVAGELKPFPNSPLTPTSENPLHIVILAFGLGTGSGATFEPDGETFLKHASADLFTESSALFKQEPFRSYKDHFKVWYLDPMYGGPDNFATENEKLDFFFDYMIQRAPSQRSIFIVYDPQPGGTHHGTFPQFIRTYNASGLVILHELGHILAGLGDEYTTLLPCSETEPSDNPFGETSANLYRASLQTNSQSACENNAEWSYWVGSCFDGEKMSFGNCDRSHPQTISCHAGAKHCDQGEGYWWRPAQSTIMRGSAANELPSVVDLTHYCRFFDKASGERLGVCAQLCLEGCSNGAKCLDPNQDGRGECVMLNTGRLSPMSPSAFRIKTK